MMAGRVSALTDNQRESDSGGCQELAVRVEAVDEHNRPIRSDHAR